jgi:hypothetical protein
MKPLQAMIKKHEHILGTHLEGGHQGQAEDSEGHTGQPALGHCQEGNQAFMGLLQEHKLDVKLNKRGMFSTA